MMRYGQTGLAVMALLGAGVAPALAQQVNLGDFTPDTARILGDPAYLPLQGQIYGSAGYSNTQNSYDFHNETVTDHWSRSSNDFLPYLAYGLTDDLSVNAQLDWGNLSTVNDFTRTSGARGRRTYYSLGADNPSFGATWRAIDQRVAPVNVDFSVNYAPDVFALRNAGPNATTGSIAEGGQNASVTGAVSRETRFLTVRGYATYGYAGRRDVIVPGGTTTEREGAHPSYAAGVQTEMRILPFVALNSGFAISHAAQYDEQAIVQGSTGSYSTQRPGTVVSPYVGFVFPLVGDRVVGELNYQHDFNNGGKVDYEYGGVGANAADGSDIYTVRVRFVLF
jgi:hypothetical protein